MQVVLTFNIELLNTPIQIWYFMFERRFIN